MNIINSLNLPVNPIIEINTDEIVTIFFDKPTRIDEIPKIDKINENYIKILTPESIINYYNDFIEGKLRLYYFNGCRIIDYDYLDCYCDWCDSKVNKSNYYYCYHCYKDMCCECYKEIDNKIHNLINPRITPDIYYCDVCNEPINDMIGRYNVYNNNNSYDICIKCYNENNKGCKRYVKLKNMEFIQKTEREMYPFYYTDFNSMLNWIPIISDDGGYIFINLNPDDKNYNKICLQSFDDHGRCGYFILYDKEYTLNYILTMLKEICDRGSFTYMNYEGKEIEKELNSEHHSSPIQILMRKIGLSVYYG